MEKIFTLDGWKLALILCLPILFAGTDLQSIVGLLYLGFIFTWIYFLGTELYERLPDGHYLNLNRFKFYFFAPFAVFALIIFLYGDGTATIEEVRYIVLPLMIFNTFCFANNMIFISKEILCIESQRKNATISECIGLAVAFWFVPLLIGVLFVQPTIKRIFENKKYKKKTITEPELNRLEKEERNLNITYTKHKYKCANGELIINQEYQNPNVGETAYLNGEIAPTGKYKTGFLQTICIIDGKVAKELPVVEIDEPIKEKPITAKTKYTKHTYKCDTGELVIEQEYQNPNYGETAYLNGKPAPTGKYKVGLFQTIFISDSKVSKQN